MAGWLIRVVQLKMPHARERLLVADAEDRIHTLLLDELLLEALQNQFHVVVRGSAVKVQQRERIFFMKFKYNCDGILRINPVVVIGDDDELNTNPPTPCQ